VTRAMAGSPLASWTIRASPLRSTRYERGRGRRQGSGAAICPPPLRRQLGQATGRASWEALALPGEMSAAALFASWVRHRRRRPARGFVSGRRLRIEPGPKGDALILLESDSDLLEVKRPSLVDKIERIASITNR
jgi:hypothetical protein